MMLSLSIDDNTAVQYSTRTQYQNANTVDAKIISIQQVHKSIETHYGNIDKKNILFYETNTINIRST